MNRIIFLDIDGPLIPEGCFYLPKTGELNASYARQFSPISVSLLKHILENTDFKIVTNSSHNYHDRYDSLKGENTISLRDDLIAAGFVIEEFHVDWRTTYPYSANYGVHSREAAIDNWIYKNGPTQWMCFDDDKFTDKPNLVHIDFVLGITPYSLDIFRKNVKELYEIEYRPL